MAFVTDTELQSYYAALGYKHGVMQNWSVLVARANSWAYSTIVAALAARGYSADQIADWDQGDDYNYSLGVYRLLLTGANSDNNNLLNLMAEQVKAFDLREDLKTVIVTTSNAVVDPEGPAGQAATGEVDGESDADLYDRDNDARPDWLRNA